MEEKCLSRKIIVEIVETIYTDRLRSWCREADRQNLTDINQKTDLRSREKMINFLLNLQDEVLLDIILKS